MPASDWTPEVADVGALLRARTKDVNGNELGTFTDDTRPTTAEVERLIVQAQSTLVGEFGGDELLPLYIETAKELVVKKAAMKVELSFYPEQVASNRSPYTQLKDEVDDELRRLRGQKIIITTEAAVDEGDPDYSFPPPKLRLRTGF